MKKTSQADMPQNIGGDFFPKKSSSVKGHFYCSPGEGLRQMVVISHGNASKHTQSVHASRTVISIFQDFFHQRKDFIDDPSVFLKEISLRAAAELMRMDDQRRKKRDHHAMLTAFFRDRGQLFTVNVGNGRIMLYRDQELTQITPDQVHYRKNPDHDIVYDPLDAPMQQQVGSLLGATFKPIELNVDGPIPLKKGDLILAFTSGVYELFSELEIVGLLKRYQHAQALSQELVRAAQEAGVKREITICHLKI